MMLSIASNVIRNFIHSIEGNIIVDIVDKSFAQRILESMQMLWILSFRKGSWIEREIDKDVLGLSFEMLEVYRQAWW